MISNTDNVFIGEKFRVKPKEFVNKGGPGDDEDDGGIIIDSN
jgi:hypothetical protein